MIHEKKLQRHVGHLDAPQIEWILYQQSQLHIHRVVFNLLTVWINPMYLRVCAGYLIMTDEWFSEYVYEVVVDKKYLAPEVLEVMQKEPIVLPAWDPMGALAL